MRSEKDKKSPDLNLAALKQGDRAVFAQFVDRYQDMVFACCRAAGLGPEDTEDAAAETFLAVYRSIHTFDGKSKLSSWLWTIAWRKALDVRSKRRPYLAETQEIAKSTAAESMPDLLEESEHARAIWQVVEQLPENQAAAIVLFYREDKTIPEIAGILQVPANTVKTWLDRGRKKLYHSLHTYWKHDHVKLG